MIKINLLPKEYRKKARKKVDVNLPLIVGALLLILFFLYIFIEAQARMKRAGAERLTADLEAISDEYEAGKIAVGEMKPLARRLKLLKGQGEDRILWARILNDLSDVFPDNLQLTFLQDEGKVLVLKGNVALEEGDENVTSLIQDLKEKGGTSFPDCFSQIALESIGKKKKQAVKEFVIKCRFSEGN